MRNNFRIRCCRDFCDKTATHLVLIDSRTDCSRDESPTRDDLWSLVCDGHSQPYGTARPISTITIVSDYKVRIDHGRLLTWVADSKES